LSPPEGVIERVIVASGVEAAYVIGVDLGGTKTRGGVLDRSGDVLRRVEHHTPHSSTDDVLAGVDRVVDELLAPDIAALGFGIPATVDQARGRAVTAPNLPLEKFPFRRRMRERFRLPVAIENDANAAAIGEWRFGAGRWTANMVMLTLGTGVGGGLILDGRPYRGSLGAAAELGHIVIQHDGPPCQGFCTGRGHLETLASGTAASRAARELLGGDADAHELVDAARNGHQAARAALATIGEKLGSAIGSLVNIFDPDVVVVGGGFGAAAGDLVLDPAREVLRREALEPARNRVRVIPAELGPEAGLVGAGLVAFEALEL
jgi:glucokinase